MSDPLLCLSSGCRRREFLYVLLRRSSGFHISAVVLCGFFLKDIRGSHQQISRSKILTITVSRETSMCMKYCTHQSIPITHDPLSKLNNYCTCRLGALVAPPTTREGVLIATLLLVIQCQHFILESASLDHFRFQLLG